MKKSISYLFGLLVLVLLVDRIGGACLSYCFRRTHAKAEIKIRHLTDQPEDEVIILGNSRCAYHYVPSVISDSIQMSVYNGGIDGSDNIYSKYIMVCHLLAHHTPAIICIETGGTDFFRTEEPFKKTAYFAPLFGLNAQADSVFRDAGTYVLYRLSALYRYNAKGIEILGGMVVNHALDNDNGYFPIQGAKQADLQLTAADYTGQMDYNKTVYMERVARMCAERNIILVWVVSPAYRTIDKGTFGYLRHFAEEHGNICLDYYSDGLFLDRPELFKDNGHLLDSGAREYSSIFAHDLLACLNKYRSSSSDK